MHNVSRTMWENATFVVLHGVGDSEYTKDFIMCKAPNDRHTRNDVVDDALQITTAIWCCV